MLAMRRSATMRPTEGTHPGSRGRMRLQKAIELFIDELRATGKSEATCVSYESHLRRLAANARHDSVLAFTEELVKGHLLWGSSRDNLKIATLHVKQVCFRQFSKWGLKHDLWTRDPLVNLAMIRRPKSLPRPFSEAETRALMALELSSMQQVARALLFFTGLRVTPICGIKVGDISYEPPTIRAIVKGAKHQVIQLHPGLAAMLDAYTRAHTDLKPWRFVLSRTSGGPLRRRDIERWTHDWGLKAGVATCTPHRFRHSFATALLRETKDLRLVQEAMGHEDPKSTMLYTEVTGERVAEGIRRLPWGIS